MEYDAHYQLIHDNLCDLSHLDFVHGETLGRVSATSWSKAMPRITNQGMALRFEQWFTNAKADDSGTLLVDLWSSYDFALPGVFLMETRQFPTGTASFCEMKPPSATLQPLFIRYEQQAVTPINTGRTAYHYATGFQAGTVPADMLEPAFIVVTEAFEEDRLMIQAQQRAWNIAPPDAPKFFMPQDRGPFLMRRMIERLIRDEAQQMPGGPVSGQSHAGTAASSPTRAERAGA